MDSPSEHQRSPSASEDELEAQAAALLAEVARKRAAKAAEKQRIAAQRGQVVLVGASPSPKTRRADSVPRHLAHGRPPTNSAMDVTHSEALQLQAGRPDKKESRFESHESAILRKPAPSTLLEGIMGVNKGRQESEKRKQSMPAKSTSFNDLRDSKPSRPPVASTSTSSTRDSERRREKSRSELGGDKGVGTSKMGASSSRVDIKPKRPLEDVKPNVEPEEDEEGEDYAVVGGQKNKKRRADWTVIEELVEGPRHHKSIPGDSSFDTIEPNSGIRLRPNSRLISHEQLQLHLTARYHLTPSQVYSLGRRTNNSVVELEVDRDVIIIGVLAWKDETRFINPQKAIKEEEAAEAERKKKMKNWDDVKGAKRDPDEDQDEQEDDDEDEDGDKPRDVFKGPTAKEKARRYIRFSLLDLSTVESAASGTGLLNVTLFESDRKDECRDENGAKRWRYSGGSGGAYEKHWKDEVGSVVAILNPRISKPPPGKPNVYSLSPDSEDSMMVIGHARDLRSCQARKADGSICNSWVDGRVSDVCTWHTERQLKRTGARRPETYSANSDLSRTVPFDRKKFQASLKAGGRSANVVTNTKVYGSAGRSSAPYDPVNKTGLLPRDNVSIVEGSKTYVVASSRGQSGRGASRILDVPGSTGGGGFIPGVRDGPSVKQTKREAKDLQMKKALRKEEKKALLEMDRGSVGSAYLRAASTKEDLDEDEEEGKEDKKRGRPFSNQAVRRLGFDPTRQATDGLDEDDDTKSKRLASISALIAFTEQRGEPNLSVLPGPRVRSSVKVPEGQSSKKVRDEDEDDLPDIRKSKKAKMKKVVEEKVEESDDDSLVILPKGVAAA